MNAWKKLEQCDKSRLRWVTIVIGGVRWRRGDDPDVVVARIIEQVTTWRQEWRRAALGRVWRGMVYAGAVEVDVVRGDAAGALGAHRAELLADLGVDVNAMDQDERIAVPHVHMVIGHADEVAVLLARAEMVRRWRGSRRVRVDPLWKSQTVPEALDRLASYCGKRRYQYSDGGWQGAEGSAVKFGDHWEDWLSSVADVVYQYLDDSGQGCLNSGR